MWTSLRRIVLRAFRAPRTAGWWASDRVVIPVWLRLLGVELGSGCRFAGWPIVTLAPAARIRLGPAVRLLSRPQANSAGIAHPVILAASTADSRIVIGAGSGVSGASIVAHTEVTIGERAFIGAGACIWDTDFHPLDPAARREHSTRGALTRPVHIGNDVFIGARAIVLKGVTVGDGAVIAAGAVVAKDVEPGTVVAGNPARAVGVAVDRRSVSGE
jgi:acetyltransferase-like isoleucine patch superfamily enzyme